MRNSKNICFVYVIQHQKLGRQNYSARLENCLIIGNSSCRCCVPAYNCCPCCPLVHNSSCPCCMPAPALVQPPQPHPLSSGIGNWCRWRPWALECRGEWHSQSYLLLLPPHSQALLPCMGCIHCLVFWLMYLSPTNGIHVHRQTWYTQRMPIIVNELIAPVLSTCPCVQFATENVLQQ